MNLFVFSTKRALESVFELYVLTQILISTFVFDLFVQLLVGSIAMAKEEVVMTFHHAAADGEADGTVGMSTTIIAPMKTNVIIIIMGGKKKKAGDAWR